MDWYPLNDTIRNYFRAGNEVWYNFQKFDNEWKVFGRGEEYDVLFKLWGTN